MSKIAQIREVMTPAPQTIGIDQPVELAQKLMADYGFRHLPVMEDDKLVGIVSDRDITLALSLLKTSASELMVRDVYIVFPYCVNADDKLDKVLRDMVTLHIGSALVMEDEKLVGIFTTMDACSVFSEMLAAGIADE